MSKPHDNLFREVFSDPQEIESLLRSALPQEMAAEIDWSSLTRVPGSFVDENLREHHTDLLFNVTIGRRQVLLYILSEHKSQSDADTVYQLLRYISRIWEHWQKTRPGEPLPPILPYVVHHGTKPWSGPTRLHQRIDFSGLSPASEQFLRGLMPDLGFVLDDLAVQSEENLSRRALSAMASLTVLMMVHARRCTAAELTEAVQRWGLQITAVLDLHGQERLLVLWSYLFQITEVAPERVAAARRAGRPHPGNADVNRRTLA